ncbi:hypothetical protein Tco_1266087 [Tanacetum coccineum]
MCRSLGDDLRDFVTKSICDVGLLPFRYLGCTNNPDGLYFLDAYDFMRQVNTTLLNKGGDVGFHIGNHQYVLLHILVHLVGTQMYKVLICGTRA